MLSTMCNLSEGIRDSAIKLGREEGIGIGREQGISGKPIFEIWNLKRHISEFCL